MSRQHVWTTRRPPDFQNPRVFAFNKAQMYAGAPTVQVVSFDAPDRGLHAAASQRAPAERHAAPRARPTTSSPPGSFLNRLHGLQVPRRLGLASPSRTFTGPDIPIRGHELAQPGRRQRAFAGRQCPRRAPDPRDDAEPVFQHRRRGVAVGHAHGPPRQHDGVRRTSARTRSTSRVAPSPPPSRRPRRGTPTAPTSFNVSCPAWPSIRKAIMAPRLQHVEHATEARHQVRGTACDRSREHLQPDRDSSDPGQRRTQTRQLRRGVALCALGRLQRHVPGSRRVRRSGTRTCTTARPTGLDHHTRIGAFSFPGCTPVGDGTAVGDGDGSVASGPIAGRHRRPGQPDHPPPISPARTPSPSPPAPIRARRPAPPASARARHAASVINDGAGPTRNFVLSAAPVQRPASQDTTRGRVPDGSGRSRAA
jgi:hypothetical protein